MKTYKDKKDLNMKYKRKLSVLSMDQICSECKRYICFYSKKMRIEHFGNNTLLSFFDILFMLNYKNVRTHG